MSRSARLAATLALVTLLAGCAGPASPGGLRPDDLQIGFSGYHWPQPLATDATGSLLEAHPLLDTASLAVEQLLPGMGAEPNIGVTSSGGVFVTTGDQVRRSTDHGRTWTIVHDFRLPTDPLTVDRIRSYDPMLWVDPVTDRVYVSHLHPALLCTFLAWSDDEGATWTERYYACGVPQADHQKIVTGPYGPGGLAAPPVKAYENVFYLCVNKADSSPLKLGSWCATSFDGGLTFPIDQQAMPQWEDCAGVHGHPATYPDGTLVLPGSGFIDCERPPAVAVSEDNGLTWTQRLFPGDVGQRETDPDVTVTPDGTAYFLLRGKDQLAYLLRSRDKFRTWEGPFRVAPPDHTLNVFTAITSGDDGRIAMAYLGTRDAQEEDADPSTALQGTRWHLFLTTSLDAGSDAPTFVTRQVTPEEDPAQYGCVWLLGGGGGPFECRNLLDFIDAVRDSEGRVHVAFTDGCTPRIGCAGDASGTWFQSRDRQVAVAVQDNGPSLLASRGDLPPIGLQHPSPLPR